MHDLPQGPPAPSATVCGADGRPDCPPIPDPRPVSRWPRIAVYGGCAVADLASTEVGLARGGQEWHPFLGNRAVRIGLKGGAAVGMAAFDGWVYRKRGRRAAWALRGAWIALNGAVVANNLRHRP